MKHLTLFGVTFSFFNKKQSAKGKNIALDNSQVEVKNGYHQGRADAYRDALLRILENNISSQEKLSSRDQ